MSNDDFDFEQIPDTRPLPSTEVANNIDGINSSDFEDALRVLSLLPPVLCHELLLFYLGDSEATTLKDVATLAGINESTLHRHISKAKTKLKAPRGLGSSPKNKTKESLRRGTEPALTYAARRDKLTKKSGKENKRD